MEELLPDHRALQALMQAYVACQVARGALPGLPEDVRNAARAPLEELCRIVGPALEAVQPGSTSR